MAATRDLALWGPKNAGRAYQLDVRAPLVQVESVPAHEATVAARLAVNNGIKVVPLVIPYLIWVDAVEVRVLTSDADANNDVGLYDHTGAKILSMGATVFNATGLKKVTLSSPVRCFPGQYYAAWTGQEGDSIGPELAHAPNLPVAGMVRRCGTQTGGGSTLPATVNVKTVTDTVSANFWAHFVGRGN